MENNSNGKRGLDSGEENSQIILKKQKLEGDGEIVIRPGSNNNSLIPAGIPRTSKLEAPIMLLTGHQVMFLNHQKRIFSRITNQLINSQIKNQQSEIYSTKFNPQGTILASASFDKTVCQNFTLVIGSIPFH